MRGGVSSERLRGEVHPSWRLFLKLVYEVLIRSLVQQPLIFFNNIIAKTYLHCTTGCLGWGQHFLSNVTKYENKYYLEILQTL